MTNVKPLSVDGDGDRQSGPDHGTALMAKLRTAVADVSAAFTLLSSARPGTSQERRRITREARGATAGLAGVCKDFERWIAEQPSSSTGEVTAGGSNGTRPTLASLSSAEEALHQARADLLLTVEAVRADGASWRRVGEALGITGQAAHKRFDPRARQRHADSMRQRNRRLAVKADLVD